MLESFGQHSIELGSDNRIDKVGIPLVTKYACLVADFVSLVFCFFVMRETSCCLFLFFILNKR